MMFDRPRMMVIKLGFVALLAVAFIVGLLMPPGSDPAKMARVLGRDMGVPVWVVWGLAASVAIAILSYAALQARGIVRHHRLPDPSDRFT